MAKRGPKKKPEEPKKTPYHDHMASWESKKESKESNVNLTPEATDLDNHPKFDKFKTGEKQQ